MWETCLAPSREGRDLGVAFQAPPGSQASSRGEAKVENPRDEGAWWATIYGVAQSLTRLKRLSSSSSKSSSSIISQWIFTHTT